MSQLTRRSFATTALGFGCALSSLKLSNPSSAAPISRPYEFANDEALVDALIKLRASTDGDLTFAWLKAARSAYIDGKIIPLLDLLAGVLNKTVKNNDGTYSLTTMEITYYLDRETGELLDTLPMPGTGRSVRVPLYRSGPKTIEISKHGVINETSTGAAGEVSTATEGDAAAGTFAPTGRVHLERSVGPALLVDDMVWIKTGEYGQVTPSNPDEASVFYKESTSWQGQRSELEDPSITSAAAQFTYAAATSWRPWMQMGDVKGHTMSDGLGSKVRSFDDLPAEFLQLTEQHHPDVIQNPEKALLG